MSELKNCPCCESSRILKQIIPPHTHSEAVKEFMNDCKGTCTIECLDCSIALIRDTESEAIAAWNRRPEGGLETITVDLNELKQPLDFLREKELLENSNNDKIRLLERCLRHLEDLNLSCDGLSDAEANLYNAILSALGDKGGR